MSKEQHSRVLIVDDARVNRMILSSLLASNGVSSDLAEGGKECLDLCSKNSYDLILLDHRMPEIDGVDTLVQLKEMFRLQGREIPVVCHTTEDARKNINLYKAAGFADVLIKPIQPKLLSEILMTYLPEGAVNDEQKKNEEQAKLEHEISTLPDWAVNIDGLDIHSAVEHCETAEDFLDALSVFVNSISEKSKEIEQFANDANWKMYTLRVHSLKSMSRLIGAEALADLAEDMEDAGKQEDVDKIMKRTPGLLADYRAFSPLMAYLSQHDSEDNDSNSTVLPDISDTTLTDAYSAISDFAECYDLESIQMVLDSLKDYHLPDSEYSKIEAIHKALSDSDWEALRSLL